MYQQLQQNGSALGVQFPLSGQNANQILAQTQQAQHYGQQQQTLNQQYNNDQIYSKQQQQHLAKQQQQQQVQAYAKNAIPSAQQSQTQQYYQQQNQAMQVIIPNQQTPQYSQFNATSSSGSPPKQYEQNRWSPTSQTAQKQAYPAQAKIDKPQYNFVFSVPKLIEPNPLDCILEGDSDIGGLYIGNLDAALSAEILKKHKIRAVLTTSVETGFRYAEESIHFHECLPAHDKEGYDITVHFEKGIEFIERNRKYTSVLVHCFAGVSRSASICIAYLMKKNIWNLEKALWHLKKCRRLVNPNVGFVRKLTEYENQLISIGHYNGQKQQFPADYQSYGQVPFSEDQGVVYVQQQILPFEVDPSKDQVVNYNDPALIYQQAQQQQQQLINQQQFQQQQVLLQQQQQQQQQQLLKQQQQLLLQQQQAQSMLQPQDQFQYGLPVQQQSVLQQAQQMKQTQLQQQLLQQQQQMQSQGIKANQQKRIDPKSAAGIQMLSNTDSFHIQKQNFANDNIENLYIQQSQSAQKQFGYQNSQTPTNPGFAQQSYQQQSLQQQLQNNQLLQKQLQQQVFAQQQI